MPRHEGDPMPADADAPTLRAGAVDAPAETVDSAETVDAPPGPAGPGTSPPPPPRRAGTRRNDAMLGRYAVVGLLGTGGMGEVLAVRDDDLGREVAAKVIRGSATEVALSKFVREARITGRLDHPGVVPVHELGRTASGEPFFTMKRISGVTLAEAIRRATPLGGLLNVFAKVCEAVAFAHSKGVLHRDLKPANVMVGDFGEVYVCDWGLARPSEGDAAHAVPPVWRDAVATPEATLDGTIVGTPVYMPPEQAAGRIAELDARSDVYSLGAVLYEILAGAPPYDGRDPYAILASVVAGATPPPPRTRRSDPASVPFELEAICAKAMAHRPDERYAGVRELAADVQAFRDGRIVGAAQYSLGAALRKTLARHPVFVRSAALVAAALVVALCVRGVQRSRDVTAARAALGAHDIGKLVAQANGVAVADVPARQKPPTVSERMRLAALAGHLQRAGEAADALRRLAPDDDEARATQIALRRAIGRIGEALHEDALAELAYGQAAAIDPDDLGTAALARRASESPAARTQAREARIAELLELARSGQLAGDWAYRDAELELATFRERAAVEALAAHLHAASDQLERAWRDAILEAAEPTSSERALGATDLVGLPPAVDAWRAARGAPLDPAVETLLRTATRRLIARAGHDRIKLAEPTLDRIVATRQTAALSAQGDRTRQIELACEALGALGDSDDAVEALDRLLWTDWDERRCAYAAFGLLRMCRRFAPALPRVMRAFGRRDDGGTARFHLQSEFVTRLATELRASFADVVRADAIARPADSHYERAVALEIAGDMDGALAALASAIAADPNDADAYVMRAAISGRRGELDSAVTDLERALMLDPRSTRGLSVLGATLRMQGRLDRARSAYDRAIELEPTASAHWRDRAEVRLLENDTSGALDDCTHAHELHPQDATVLVVRGRVRMARREMPAADLDFARARELDPRSWSAWYFHGQTRTALRDLKGALAALDRATELDPRQSRVYVARGEARLEAGDRPSALADADAALALESGNPAALILRGRVLGVLRRFPEALAALTEAASRDPSGRALCYRGEVYRFMGDRRAAHADFTAAIELAPRNALAHFGRGNVRGVEGDFPGALADLDRAIELDPGFANAHGDRGAIKQHTGDLAGALADYDQAIALQPGSAPLWRNRAIVNHAKGDREAALRDVEQAIALDPYMAEAYGQRGQLYAERGDLEKAIADFDRSLSMKADQVWVLCNRACARLDRGEVAGACSDADRAAEVAPNTWQAHAIRGRAHAHASRTAEARAAFERALAVAPAGAVATIEQWRREALGQ